MKNNNINQFIPAEILKMKEELEQALTIDKNATAVYGYKKPSTEINSKSTPVYGYKK